MNPEYYGYHGIHNNGHNIISLALDPRNELGIPPGKYLKKKYLHGLVVNFLQTI